MPSPRVASEAPEEPLPVAPEVPVGPHASNPYAYAYAYPYPYPYPSPYPHPGGGRGGGGGQGEGS